MLGFTYKKALKPLFFLCDPERVHDGITKLGSFLGRFDATRKLVSWLFSYANPVLEQVVAGIRFNNPIGLAAGFDKNGELTQILPSVGFGFEEVGSVTGEPCAGNPRPRLWRLQKSQSLLVYYGLKNDGAARITAKLKAQSGTCKTEIPIGVSIAKTNSEATVEEQKGIGDYLKAYRSFVEAGIGDYYAINISCPNAYGGEPFTTPEKLDRLLTTLLLVPPPAGGSKPIFIKMPAEISNETLDGLIEVARKHKITGFISTNLAKSRQNGAVMDSEVPENGGMSGKVVQELSDKQIEYIYRKCGREFVIIGCGGVFTAEDAYRKIKLGASLIQMITGVIYLGPQVVGEINMGLVKLLERDGYKNISEAVGTAHQIP